MRLGKKLEPTGTLAENGDFSGTKSSRCGLPLEPQSWSDMPSFKGKATLQAKDLNINTWPGVMPPVSKTWLLPQVKNTIR